MLLYRSMPAPTEQIFLNAAKRHLIQSVETLWDKCAVSSRALETERTATLIALDGFLAGLGYLK